MRESNAAEGVDELMLGDAYELIKGIPDKSIDLIVTDPPYEFDTSGCKTGLFKHREGMANSYGEIRDNGLDKGVDLMRLIPELDRVMRKPNIYIWCNKEQIAGYLDWFVKDMGCNFEIIIWAKRNPPPFTSGHYLKDKEYCLYFWKGVRLGMRYERARTVYVTDINSADKKRYGHPTIKPFGIIQNLIENSTLPGGVVLDPFMGSGTTCAAARAAGRHYVGFEINERYFRIAEARVAGASEIIKRADGTQFEQGALF